MKKEIKKLPKLVRDYIPGIIVSSGRRFWAHSADSIELPLRLREKMQEELEEFYEEPSLSEAADLYEVFITMLSHFKLCLEDVILVSKEKRAINGAFDQGIILDEIEGEIKEDNDV